MIPFKIDGRKVDVPTSWGEVSYALFIELSLAKNDMVKCLSAITHIDANTLKTGSFSQGLDALFSATKFLVSYPCITEYPKKLGPYKIGDAIPTLEQLEHITDHCNHAAQSNDLRVQLESLASIAAIYCQGTKEPYDKEKAVWLRQQLMEYPCEDVLSVGNFFQSKALSMISRRPQKDLRKMVRFTRPTFLDRLKAKWL